MIEISAGNMTAALAPELGGAVMRVAQAGRDMLRPAKSVAAVAADPREAACFPCVPWFGRLFDGLTVDGRDYDLAPTLPACDATHPLHGVGWINPWRVETRRADAFRCILDYEPEPRGFPFPFRAAQEFTVTPAEFSVVLSLTNTGRRAMPAGLGLHPFFPRRAETAFRFSANRLWTPGPKGGGVFHAPVPAAFDFSQGAAPPPSSIDHTYDGWSGAATVEDEGGTVSIFSDAPYLHLHAPAEEDFICLEPITHLPGTFGHDILNPAETITMRLRLFVEGQDVLNGG